MPFSNLKVFPRVFFHNQNPGGAYQQATARAAADEARGQELHRQQQSAGLAGAATDWIQRAMSGATAPWDAARIAGAKSELTDAATQQQKRSALSAAAAYAGSGIGRRSGGLAAGNIAGATAAAAARQAGRAKIGDMAAQANFAAQQSAAQAGAPAMINANIARFQPEIESLRQKRYDVPEPGAYPTVRQGGGGVTRIGFDSEGNRVNQGNYWERGKGSGGAVGAQWKGGGRSVGSSFAKPKGKGRKKPDLWGRD